MSLNDLCNGVDIAEKLKSDRALVFFGTNSEFLKYSKQKGIDLTYAGTDPKNQIAPIDFEIMELRKRTHKKQNKKTRQGDYVTIAWCTNPM